MYFDALGHPFEKNYTYDQIPEGVDVEARLIVPSSSYINQKKPKSDVNDVVSQYVVTYQYGNTSTRNDFNGGFNLPSFLGVGGGKGAGGAQNGSMAGGGKGGAAAYALVIKDYSVVPVKIPYIGNYDAVTITVSNPQAGVTTSTYFPIAKRYFFAISALGLVSNASTTYTVGNGLIASSQTSVPLNYYLGFQFYPSSIFDDIFFNSNYTGKGRYFDGQRNFVDFGDKWSVVLGINVTNPTQSLFLGPSFDLFNGFTIMGGANIQNIPVLTNGLSAGQSIMGMSVPTNNVLNVGWSLGIGLSTSVLGN